MPSLQKFTYLYIQFCSATRRTGRTAGGAYAGATAGNGVGASAALGGGLDEEGSHGGSGAEAHAGGISKKVVKLSQAEVGQAPQTVSTAAV